MFSLRLVLFARIVQFVSLLILSSSQGNQHAALLHVDSSVMQLRHVKCLCDRGENR